MTTPIFQPWRDRFNAGNADLTYKQSVTGRLAFDRVTTSSAPLAVATTRHADKLAEWPGFVREVFGRVYRPADAESSPLAQPEPWAAKATASLESHPEFAELRAAARGSRVLSASAATALSEGVAKAIGIDRLASTDAAKRPAQHRKEIERICKLAEEMRAAGADVAAGETEANARMQGQTWKTSIARRANVTGAVDDAALAIGCIVADVAAAVGEQSKALAIMRSLLGGAGVHAGSSEMDDGDVPDDLVRMIADGKLLADVLALLGKMHDSEVKSFAAPIGRGRLDVTGVTTGGDVQRLVGTELAMLGRADTRLDVLRRLVDKTATVREQRGEERKNNGAFVLLGDRSGSMSGKRIVAARACLLSMLLAAVKQRRPVVLVMFDHRVRDAVNVSANGVGMMAAIRELMLEPSGGTDAVGAMSEARKHLGANAKLRVDTAIVTDGEWADPPVDVRAQMRRAGGQFHEIRIVDDLGLSSTLDAREARPWMDSFTALDAEDVGSLVTATKTITRKKAT